MDAFPGAAGASEAHVTRRHLLDSDPVVVHVAETLQVDRAPPPQARGAGVSDGFQIHGYLECGCGTLLPHTELRPAPPMCPECRADLAAKVTEAQIAYEVQGRTFTTPQPKPPKRRTGKKKPLTEKQKDDRRKLDRADRK